MSFQSQHNHSRIVGLDLSTNSVAFSLFVDKKLDKWGEFHMKGKPAQRNVQGNRFGTWLRKELNPDLIAYESAVYIQNKKTVISLAYAFGAVVSSMGNESTDVREFVPVEWQSFIGNKVLTPAEKNQIKTDNPGKSQAWYKNQHREFRKQRTMDWVNGTYSLDISSDNISDAIAIGYTAANKAWPIK